jgi:hypothetical protein
VLVMSERQLLRNASSRSSGNGCGCLSCFPSHVIFTYGAQLADKVKKLAGKTHKDRVHEFNSKLESLSEHHDIPKVNFTGDFFGASSNRIISHFSGWSWIRLAWGIPECRRRRVALSLAVQWLVPCWSMLCSNRYPSQHSAFHVQEVEYTVWA